MEDAAEYGERGVLAYDAVDDRVQCHACGRWFQRLNHAHLRRHGLDEWTYKERYGLNTSTPLMTPRLVERYRQHCRDLIDAGKLLTAPPAHTAQVVTRPPGTPHRAEYHRRYMTPARRAELSESRRRWTDEALLEALRTVQAACGGTLTQAALQDYCARRPGAVPHSATVIARFGSWRRVCELLGQPYPRPGWQYRPNHAPRWTDDAILDSLDRLRNHLEGPLTAHRLHRMYAGQKGKVGDIPSYKTVLARFGSWDRVLELLDARAASAPQRTGRDLTRRDSAESPTTGASRDGRHLCHGSRGVLAYDATRDRVQCHACGQWFKQISAAHLRVRHAMTVQDYRERFGLSADRPLVTPRLSDRLRQLLAQRKIMGVLQPSLRQTTSDAAGGDLLLSAAVARMQQSTTEA